MSRKHPSSATKHFNRLIQFRQAAYQALGNARDALFELGDAVLLTPQARSLAELSCSWVFRRKWCSVYEALQDGRPDRSALLALYRQHLPEGSRPVLAGDHTAWPRPSAWTLRDRTVEHQPSPVPGNRPITIGQGYSSLVMVPEPHSSWALPLLHERMASTEKPVPKASDQLRRVCAHLPQRPITLWDSEYGCAAFLKQTADIPADKVIRLRTNLCLVGPPGPYKGRGPYPKHGAKFNFKDESTWWAPDEGHAFEDPEFGPVKVQVWHTLHFRQAAECSFRVARVVREQAPGTRRSPKVLWFAWIGEEPPAEIPWWQWYARRYPVDHWYRFIKGRLFWTLPMLTTPEQMECWSDLMPLLTWELWLARECVPDEPLPWQKPQTQLTPGRVCQGLPALLGRIGTPARAPKPRGKSPGWPKGKPRQRRPRYEVVKKRPKQAATSA
jgi:hypothetical protein